MFLWQNNEHNTSCIPPNARYPSKRGIHPKHGETFEVFVPGRDGILFHKGNFQTDSSGCILLATGYGWLNGQLAVTNSGTAWMDFKEHMKGIDEFELIVKAV